MSSSRELTVLHMFLLRFTPNYRSTGAGGTFTPVPFSHNLEIRPVCISQARVSPWS